MISLIFDEGPIARCYLELSKHECLKFEEIIYLGRKFFFLNKNFSIKINFHIINKKPIIFLKDENIKKLVSTIEDYFELKRNFFKNAYRFNNLDESCKNFHYLNKNINTLENCKIIKDIGTSRFLISGKTILKEILNTNKDFLHIHPAYLPDIRGADGSLWNIKNKNCFGGSAFLVDKKIDTGDIIYRELINLNNFKILDHKYKKKLNDIWFCFIDPAIRCKILKNLIKNKMLIAKPEIKNQNGDYFSFMEPNDKQKILESILLK